MPRLLPAALAALVACQGVSPVTNKIAVGEEPFVVLVGTGPDGAVDLFAGQPGGGVLYRLTFTRGREWAPAIHPAGTAVAFLRGAVAPGDSTVRLSVMNLVNAAERDAVVPVGIGRPRAIGWSPDGSRLYVTGEYGFAASDGPPARMALAVLDAGDPEAAAADSATSVLLGDPPAARVEPCGGSCIAGASQVLCVVTAGGERQELGSGVRGAARWGPDSLAYLEGERLVVRALAGGRPRLVSWSNAPRDPAMPTYWARP